MVNTSLERDSYTKLQDKETLSPKQLISFPGMNHFNM